MTEDQESHQYNGIFIQIFLLFASQILNVVLENGRFFNPPEKHLLIRISYVFAWFLIGVHAILCTTHNVILLCCFIRIIAIALISIYKIRNRQNENPAAELNGCRMNNMRIFQI